MNSIHNLAQKIKGFILSNREDIFTYIIVIFVGISSFYIGKMSTKELDNDNIYIVNSETGKSEGNQLANSLTPLKDYVNKKNEYNTSNENSVVGNINAMYVASSRGKLYYRIGCGGSTKLVENNKVFFNTKEQAEAKGYKPAANCAP